MTVSPFSNTSSASNSLAAVVVIRCELVRGTEARVLEEFLPRVKRESLALNLAAVGRIDAAGIAALVKLYCNAINAGTDFSVIEPSPHVLELLQVVGLETILIAERRADGMARRCIECPAA